ncbi:MAG TPA: hypothetical protein V6C98_04505, partial [Thermosynechococcaceae cyanobacterium]
MDVPQRRVRGFSPFGRSYFRSPSHPLFPLMTDTWNRHHVLSLADFTPDEYDTVLQTASSFREVLSRRTKKVP